MPGVLKPLAPNWYDHLAAWIKGERNHPSVMLWSVENEISFITARNMGQLDVWEPITTQGMGGRSGRGPDPPDDGRRRRGHPCQYVADPRRSLLDQSLLELPTTGL